MLSSPTAISIRQSIIDGSYRFCHKNICGIIVNNQLNTKESLPQNVAELIKDSTKFDYPYEIMLNGDRTCNLSCPSCRTSIIKNSEETINTQTQIGNTLYQNLFSESSNNPILLSLSGSGEVFASPMLLSFLENINLDHIPNLRLHLHTNGLLAPQRWHRIQHLEPAIQKVVISIDAASKVIYEQVRRGGNWEELCESLEFFKNKKEQLNFKFATRMIFQQANYQEAVAFYNFSKYYNADRIEYSRLTNWNTWNSIDFLQQDVLQYKNKHRDTAIDMIKKLRTLPNVWFEGDFS
jgi:wyosine [tRNA(Phe)-imidazoG37] synthetase (radical SAM superfamily)